MSFKAKKNDPSSFYERMKHNKQKIQKKSKLIMSPESYSSMLMSPGESTSSKLRLPVRAVMISPLHEISDIEEDSQDYSMFSDSESDYRRDAKIKLSKGLRKIE